ncbi:GntR family transcriptional regulator [Lysinibacillus sp. 2017]|uniref:aminotransferase-like domain-containing protein n=1 Tax=unclassified Lysinibacillus TaxID=2636778 RepID=UPI000D52A206|nr:MULTISPECIES: PLP-dependent aminotransferase family protein [unclassified Lysinibacillus]AWE07305.1 GntR family transcriptional regulator [Lysinibacillus sp. 2017]TGN32069.1 PLP-dependent aminotransferase family protein [Lysinibacillus sp. S2017]
MKAKYLEIVDTIKQQLQNGDYQAGSKLPSIRQLSVQFNCSKNTILKAYDELEKEHVLYAKAQSGYYIVNDYKTMLPTTNEIDFYSAGPAKDLIPYTDFQHCLNQAIDTYKEELFDYAAPQGLYSLRTEIAKRLQTLQVFTTPNRVVMVSGSQQALHLLTTMPFPNGKKNILIEQPTYFGMIESLNLSQTTTFGIELTMNGIDLERLEYIFKNNEIKFFYVIPRFHNPLGHCYTNLEKKKIVELAKKYDVYIVEDDFLGELDTDKKADPFFSFDPSGRVIYIQSYSKIFLPGLRIASIVLHELLIKTFLRYKISTDFTSPILSQGALDIYLKSGMYVTHLKKIKKVYQHKMDVLKKACAHYLPVEIDYTKPSTGFYLSIYLPKNISAKKLTYSLAENNILVDDTERMFLDMYKQDNLIRLCISQLDEQQIISGIKKIGDLIVELNKRKSTSRKLPPPSINVDISMAHAIF